MKPDVSDSVITAISEHAIEFMPEEICGLVVNGNEYVPMENLADDKVKYFKFDKDKYSALMATGTVTHVVHSHMNQDYPSQYDMQQQVRTGVPWIICNMSQGRRPSLFMWGHSDIRPPILGREFRHGVTDCYALLRDFYLAAGGIRLPEFPREFEWWFKADDEGPISMFMKNAESAGFTRISESELRPFDVVLAQIAAKVPNHCGVYLGNDLVLHHMYNRASRREPYSRIRSRAIVWLRYTKGVVPNEVGEAIWGTG